MPGAALDVLSAVEAQLPADLDARAAIMVLDLEAAAPSSAPRPALAHLNVSRPAWRERLPHVIVFWVPEYLVALLGREAPDFMDWCSGFLDFTGAGRDAQPQRTPAPPKLDSAYEALSAADRAERVRVLGESSRRPPPLPSEGVEFRPTRERAEAGHHERAARATRALERGRHLVYLGATREALAALEDALESARQARRRDVEVDALTDIASVQISLGHLEDAARTLDEAQTCAEALDRDDVRVDVLANRVTLTLARGDGPSAEQHARTALAIEGRRRGQRPERMAGLYASLAAALLYQGQNAKAESELQTALELARSLDPVAGAPTAGSALVNLGALAVGRGDLLRAGQHFEDALALAERSGHAWTLAYAEANLGALRLGQGRNAEAGEHLKRALTSYERLGDRRGLANVHRDVAMMARVACDLPTARTHLQLALRLFRDLGMAREAAETERTLATLASTEPGAPITPDD